MSVTPRYTDQVQVEEKTETETRTTISLAEDNADLTKEYVLLEDALEVEVLSNVNWKLVASVESDYVNYSELQLDTTPKLDVWVKPDMGEFVKLTNLDREFISRTGSFKEKKWGFGISYRIGLPQKEGAEITGAGAEVVYTLMQLW